MGFLTGSPAKQSSSNRSYDDIEHYFQPALGYTTQAGDAMAGILGVGAPRVGTKAGQYSYEGGGAGGGAGGTSALGGLQNYFNSSGGQFQLNQGLDALTNKFSALGLSRSGAAMKGMEQFRSDLVSTKLDNYLGQLNELARLGLGSAGAMAGAGQVSKGSGASEGLGSLIGPILSAVAMSDPAAKTKMERIGDWDDRGDGLGKWRFAYKWEPDTILEGVMADEVERLRPNALGPLVRGYRTVNYAMLEAA